SKDLEAAEATARHFMEFVTTGNRDLAPLSLRSPRLENYLKVPPPEGVSKFLEADFRLGRVTIVEDTAYLPLDVRINGTMESYQMRLERGQGRWWFRAMQRQFDVNRELREEVEREAAGGRAKTQVKSPASDRE